MISGGGPHCLVSALLQHVGYGAVCPNFILQLFCFLKETFCCNFYEVFKKNLAKCNFTNNFPGVGKSALRLLCFINASSNCLRMRNE